MSNYGNDVNLSQNVQYDSVISYNFGSTSSYCYQSYANYESSQNFDSGIVLLSYIGFSF